MTRVKICGVMNEDGIEACVDAGVDAIGFVVGYPVPVPWNLSAVEARKLIEKVPPFISTCVVTGGSAEYILNIAEKTLPDIIQLHHGESLAVTGEIADKLNLKGIRTIKALRINAGGKCDFEIEDPAMAAGKISKSCISAILADSYTESMPGGTGTAVDLSIYKSIRRESSVPVILAGGLNPSNLRRIIHEVQPFAVDILTGAEERPGKKDVSKIKDIMFCCRQSAENR